MTSNPYESPSSDGIRGSCTSDSVVEFDYTMQDAVEFSLRENRDYVASSVRQRRTILLIAALVFAVLGGGMLLLSSTPVGAMFSALPISLMSVYFFFRAAWVRNRVDKAVRKTITEMQSRRPSSGMLGRHTVSLTEDGISSVYPGGDSRWMWWAVPEIVTEEDAAYIYLAGTEAKTIPARAFATDEHFRAFVANARSLWEQKRVATEAT